MSRRVTDAEGVAHLMTDDLFRDPATLRRPDVDVKDLLILVGKAARIAAFATARVVTLQDLVVGTANHCPDVRPLGRCRRNAGCSGNRCALVGPHFEALLDVLSQLRGGLLSLMVGRPGQIEENRVRQLRPCSRRILDELLRERRSRVGSDRTFLLSQSNSVTETKRQERASQGDRSVYRSNPHDSAIPHPLPADVLRVVEESMQSSANGLSSVLAVASGVPSAQIRV